MSIVELSVQGTQDVERALGRISEASVESLIEQIMAANKIYIGAAGRSLLLMRCFAMRLMHLGFQSFVVGDTTTPAFEAGDLLITGSTSGETTGQIMIAERAKKLGGRVALITANPESTLAKYADVVVCIPVDARVVGLQEKTISPKASVFEQSLLLLCDTLVIPLAEKTGTSLDGKFAKHANLE